jgi:serine/threonine protein kinase
MADGGGEGVDLGIPGLGPAVLVGRGGFGLVYRATQLSSHGVVAVKVAQDHLDRAATIRFEREASALGRLRGHPNICTVYDAGIDAAGRPYLVMELAPSSLADRIAADGPLPWEEVAALGVRMAGAMETAHLAGLLHRDVKPENILLTPYGEWRLADFGLARQGDETLSGDVTATLSHAAPELIEGVPPSVASDVYALGSTLFAALTGRPAFARQPDAHQASVYRRIAEEPVPDMPGTPDDVAEVVRRAMAKAPSDRYASAAELGSALQQAQERAGLSATPLPILDGDTGVRTEGLRREPPGADPEPTADDRTPHQLGDHTEALQRGGRDLPPTEEAPDEPPSAGGPDRRMLLHLAIAAAVSVLALILAALTLGGGDGDTDEARATTTTTEAPPSTVDDDMIRLAEDWQLVQITTDACMGADFGPCPLDDGFFPYFSVDCPPAEDLGGFGRSAGQVAEPSCTISFMELEPAEASFDGEWLYAHFMSSSPPGEIEIQRGAACPDAPVTYTLDLLVEGGEVRDGQLTAIQLRGDLSIYVDSPTDPSCGSYYQFSDFVVQAAS